MKQQQQQQCIIVNINKSYKIDGLIWNINNNQIKLLIK